MNKKILSLICAAATALPLAACSGGTHAPEPADSGKLQVYTSFYAMYDFAREIGGDKAEVHNLCPTGSEPHDYEPTAQDMALLTDADVFVYNGLGMESWAESVSASLKGTEVFIVEAACVAPNITENYDPHVWLDPENAYAEMKEIADSFIAKDPENADYYSRRLDGCAQKLDALTAAYQEAVSGFSSRNIVVSHAAYLNLCNAFHLVQTAVNGIDNEEDPTPQRMAEIEDFIKANGVSYIFTEPLGTSAVVEAIAKDTGCELLTLDPFEGNLNDEDYFTVMYNNLDALKTALR